MKLGQPIDGRLGELPFNNSFQIPVRWKSLLNDRKSPGEASSGASEQDQSFAQGKGFASSFSNPNIALVKTKVAGMEAPAPPSFHLVCRGVPSAEQSIALLYSASCPSGGGWIILFSVVAHLYLPSLLGGNKPTEITGLAQPESGRG